MRPVCCYIGTQNVIDLCRRHGVGRLVFTSTAAVALQPYMGRTTFALVINQSESKVLPPASDAGFLVPGYPASKLRAEELVLAANGTPLADGKGRQIITHDLMLANTILFCRRPQASWPPWRSGRPSCTARRIRYSYPV